MGNFFLFSPKWSKLSVKTATHSKIIGQLQNLLWWADRNLGGRGGLASWHYIFHFTQQRFVWLTKLSHENSCIENWNSYGPWLTVGGTSWGTCDNSGWPQHHKKCQEKPPAIQTWQMVQLVNSYLKQAGTRPYPGSHTSKKRKLNERFCLVWRTTYVSSNISEAESGSGSSRVWQKLHDFCLDVRFVWLLEVLPWSSLSSCHQLSHRSGRAGAGWKQQSTTCQENRIRRITIIIIIIIVRQNTFHTAQSSGRRIRSNLRTLRCTRWPS